MAEDQEVCVLGCSLGMTSAADGSPMVRCPSRACGRWYHFKCVGLRGRPSAWLCAPCSQVSISGAHAQLLQRLAWVEWGGQGLWPAIVVHPSSVTGPSTTEVLTEFLNASFGKGASRHNKVLVRFFDGTHAVLPLPVSEPPTSLTAGITVSSFQRRVCSCTDEPSRCSQHLTARAARE